MAKADTFDQFMAFGVTQSAANTLTFGDINIGVSLFDYAGFVISRVEYTMGRATMAELVGNADSLVCAICGAQVTDVADVTNPQIYDNMAVIPQVAANGATQILIPIIHDFSSMLGGGLMVPAQTIRIGVQTAGFAAAGTVTGRIYYSVRSLQAADYLELVQRFNVLTT